MQKPLSTSPPPSCKRAAAPATDANAADPDQVELSHPQRVVFPGIGITKRDVADNYQSVSEWLLAELRAWPGAPVAMPIGWQELDRIGGAAAFDIGNTPRRLMRLKRHPWEGIDTVEQGLSHVGGLLHAEA